VLRLALSKEMQTAKRHQHRQETRQYMRFAQAPVAPVSGAITASLVRAATTATVPFPIALPSSPGDAEERADRIEPLMARHRSQVLAGAAGVFVQGA